MKYMFMPLRRYADFSGRSRRLEFWLWMLFNWIILAVLGAVLAGFFLSAVARVDERGGLSTGGYERSYDRDYDRDRSSRYEDEERSSSSYDDEDRYSSRRDRDRDASGFEFQGDMADIDVRMFNEEFGIAGKVMIGLLCLWWLLTLIPNLAVAIRRLHDTNKSGWWILAPYAAYALAIILVIVAVMAPETLFVLAPIAWLLMAAAGLLGLVLLVFMFLDGTPGVNRFGPDPKGRDYDQTFR
jgi:uncharacterized membrane protein YhaH (DUF805 family)